MNIDTRLRLTAGTILLSASLAATAAPITYTDRAAFDAAIGGFSSSIQDFEGSAAGDLIADGGTLGGLTFAYPTLAGLGVSLAVTDGAQFGGSGPFDTTSGANFLGTDDGDLLQDGDDFGLSFALTNAIGMYFLSSDPLLDDDILLSVGATTASLLAADLQDTLADGTNVFFLGIVDAATAFSGASVVTSNGGNGFFLWNVDDIVTSRAPQGDAPAPATLALLGVGLGALRARRRKCLERSRGRRPGSARPRA